MIDPDLYILCSPGGYYPYVRIAWCIREDNIIRLLNCRIIKRFGTEAELADIAETGPKANTILLKMAKQEFCSSGMVSRLIGPCNHNAWADECPMPEGFVAAAATNEG